MCVIAVSRYRQLCTYHYLRTCTCTRTGWFTSVSLTAIFSYTKNSCSDSRYLCMLALYRNDILLYQNHLVWISIYKLHFPQKVVWLTEVYGKHQAIHAFLLLSPRETVRLNGKIRVFENVCFKIAKNQNFNINPSIRNKRGWTYFVNHPVY